MKITLIQPALSSSDRYGKHLGKVGPTCEPLGLAYLAAAIRERREDDEIEIIDAVALKYKSEDLKNHLLRTKPDVVGLGVLTPMYLVAKETIDMIHETLPDCTIVFGGPHPSIFPEITLEENPNVDYIVIGEGEWTFVELLDSLENKCDVRDVKGIAYRKNGKIVMNEARPFVKDIDELPIPARDLLPMELYRPAPTYYIEAPSYLMLTTRGCPFMCSYCSKVFGQTFRHHSVDRILREVNILINKYEAKEIIFRDDTFTINADHVKNLCKAMINQGIHKKIRWTCMTRVNLVTKDLLEEMKEAGCWSIHYGVESGNQRLLNLIKKGITIQQIQNAFKWTREVGIETKAFFMIGLPTETPEETLRTMEFTRELDPDWIQATITVPYPGTALYNLVKDTDTLKSFKWEDYQTWAGWSDTDLIYVPEGRDADDLKMLQKKVMRDFYFRPKFILRQLKFLKTPDRIKAYFNGGYALFKSKS